jgi:hypothetical protein
MPWPDEFSFDPYAGAPNPFAPPAPPPAMPQSWLDIVANAPDQPPSVPMPDPLGLPPAALEGVGAALPPPPPPEPQAAPPFQMPELFGGAPDAQGFPPPAAAEQPPPPFQLPEFLGGPAPAAPAAPPPVYTNPLEDPGLDELGAGRALADLSDRNPEDAALIAMQLEDKRKALTEARDLKAANDAVEEQKRIADTRVKSVERARASTEKLNADATALANQKVDPERWWASRSTGQKIAGVLAAVIGGLVQGRVGGRNTGLDMINDAIEKDIAAQQQNLAHKRELLGVRRSSIGDQDKYDGAAADAADLHRVASYKLVAQQLEAERTQYDPRGTKSVRIAGVIAGVRAAEAKAAQAHGDRVFKREGELIERDLKTRKQFEDERAARQREADARARLAFDRQKQSQDADLKRQEIAAKKDEAAQAKVDKAADKRAEQDRELGVGGGSIARKVVQDVADPVTGKVEPKEVIVREDTSLLGKDGKPWHAPDALTAQKLRAQATGTQDLVDALGDLRQLRADAGGANKVSSPDAQAKYMMYTNKAIIAYATSKGMSLADEQSQEFARKAIMGPDPSGYRIGDVIERIDKTIGDSTRSYHTALQAAQFKGELPKFDKRPDPAGLTKAEEISKTIRKDRTPLEVSAAAGDPGLAKKAVQKVFYWRSDDPTAIENAGSVKVLGVSEKQAKEIEALATMAKGADEVSRNAARQELVNLATSPGTQALHVPVMNFLEDNARDLFHAAVEKLPPDERETWAMRERMRDDALLRGAR